MPLHARVAAIFAAYFFGLGLFLPFFPLVLSNAGLSPGEIGTLLAIPMLVRLAANPLIGAAVDRFGTPGRAVALLSILAAIAFSGFFLAKSFFASAVLLVVISIAWSPLMPLGDALAARVEREGKGDYGRMRLWGSVSFIVANVIGGALIGEWTTGVVVGGIVAGLVAAGAAALSVKLPRIRVDENESVSIASPDTALAEVMEEGAPQPVPARRKGLAALLREGAFVTPGFLLVILAAACAQASHAAYYAFSALHWSQTGVSGAAVGIYWGLGVITEIGLFAASARVRAVLGVNGLLAIGIAGAVLRWILFPFVEDPVSIVLVQLLHGLSFGATHLGAVAFVARMAPPQWAGAAQGVNSMVIGAVTALASAAAGVLYASSPVSAFLAMSVLSGIGGLCLLAGLVVSNRAKRAG
ncbi:MFS transporter [Stappia indica]|uniref:MFS transporter, PPP family, 3-phenylpropionic acid transporter n=1 Tax=Stappia indica TaxID=538381 RepID=A0A285RA14_9HYPH|nr:MFS transporter [Stappia indica]SOB89217.1 MFS transporter, PPP family, 3-phenylpropionic acid transporter [Stappia indica]